VLPSAVQQYLRETPLEQQDTGALAFLCALAEVARKSPPVAKAIVQELRDQRSHLKLIASENYSSLATQLAMGNWLTDKYAEGIPFQRFYEGCDNIDRVESFAVECAKKLFNAEHAYVQPHSGADANLIALWAVLTVRVELPALQTLGIKDPLQLAHEDWEKIRRTLNGQRLLGMDYMSGGHLTHGYRRNVSAKMFETFTYHVDRETGLLNYDRLAAQAREVKPLVLLAGYSAYPRRLNFARLREIAEEVGAVLMVDMAHFAGLVAGGVFSGEYNPVPYAHIVTTTTHKTLRGPRGGLVLCTKEFAEAVDRGCPLVIGGPLPHVMAAKAVALVEAGQPDFREYAHAVVRNAQVLADACLRRGMHVLTGGTENHIVLLNVVQSYGLTGKQAATALRECGVTLNFNSIPYDENPPLIASGLRLGTPAVTTLGMGPEEMKEIADIIHEVLSRVKPAPIQSGAQAGQLSKRQYLLEPEVRERAQARVNELLQNYVLYPQLDADLLSAVCSPEAACSAVS